MWIQNLSLAYKKVQIYEIITYKVYSNNNFLA